MEDIKTYNLTQKQLQLIFKSARNLYHTSVVIEHFCLTQVEIEALENILPIISLIRNNADIINSFCVNFENNNLD
ncbi:MAG: hypothetical protein R3Y28_03425 [Candidatus Gastranaerophilales bacterium]